LLLTVTVVAVVAAAFNVTVQVLEAAPDTDVGLQASDVSVGAVMVNVTPAGFEAPFSVAVTVTMAFNALPAVTENCAEV